MHMKKLFRTIILFLAVVMSVSCSHETDEAAGPLRRETVQFAVGAFPAFESRQTRTIGVPNEGKTEWTEGDKILVSLTSSKFGKQDATLVYGSSGWTVKDGKSLFCLEGEQPTATATYAPDYVWMNGSMMLKDGKVEGTDEYFSADCTVNGNQIEISFKDAGRKYSRLRIATMKNTGITVVAENFTPVNGGMEYTRSYTLTSDDKGNAYLYGTFVKNTGFSVKYKGSSLADYVFSATMENGKSYALDATAVSLVDKTTEEIQAAVKAELDAGKKDINLILASDADEDVLDAIQNALDGETRVNLMLIGIEKIPEEGFYGWSGLKSITLPDVTEIGASAFKECYGLQTVSLGNLTKVFGKDIFITTTQSSIDLYLSGEQKMMKYNNTANPGYWSPGELNYINSIDHKRRSFLGYTFNSIKCGDTTY